MFLENNFKWNLFVLAEETDLECLFYTWCVTYSEENPVIRFSAISLEEI